MWRWRIYVVLLPVVVVVDVVLLPVWGVGVLLHIWLNVAGGWHILAIAVGDCLGVSVAGRIWLATVCRCLG